MFELPPRRLEELAGVIGNSAMQSLVDAQAPPLREVLFRMPEAEPGTAPVPVPEGRPLALVSPEGLTAMAAAGAAAAPGAPAV